MTVGPSALQDYLRARRADIDSALNAILPASPACPAVLATAMRYSLDSGGKRLRPILCLASAETIAARDGVGREAGAARDGVEREAGARTLALPAACAIELIHTYSLIHDDLPAMDDDTVRRGRPTLHVAAGEGMAILAGDGLLTEAFALMSREPRSTDPVIVDRKLRAIGVVAAAAGAAGMVGGQAIDLASVTPGPGAALPPPLGAEGLRRMHAMKTGALIRGAASAGAIMAGADGQALEAIGAAAAELGLAFQIIDDVLDVEGASGHLGKTAGKDEAAGKPTYPALYGLDASRRMASDCIARAEATLRSAGLADARLLEIGRWVVQRTR